LVQDESRQKIVSVSVDSHEHECKTTLFIFAHINPNFSHAILGGELVDHLGIEDDRVGLGRPNQAALVPKSMGLCFTEVDEMRHELDELGSYLRKLSGNIDETYPQLRG
jgi:hypothetical protein